MYVPLQGWVVATNAATSTNYVITGLEPDYVYIFIIRARNAHGVGWPSMVTDPIRTRSLCTPLDQRPDNRGTINWVESKYKQTSMIR